MQNTKAVYNVILGDYDDLHDPVITTPGWDYICFTDDKNMRSDIWQIKVIEKDKGISNSKMAKKIMILNHRYVGEYDTTICVPGYSVISIDLDVFLQQEYGINRQMYDMALLSHPAKRGGFVYKESENYANLIKGNISYEIIIKQMNKYRSLGMPENLRMYATGIMIRNKNNINLRKHNELWWSHVYNYSNLDQLSLAYILWKYELIKICTIGFKHFNNYFRGEFHHKRSRKENLKNREY